MYRARQNVGRSGAGTNTVIATDVEPHHPHHSYSLTFRNGGPMDLVTPKKMRFSRGCGCFRGDCSNHIGMQQARRGVWSVGGNPFCSRTCAQWLADEVNRLRRMAKENDAGQA